MKLKVETLIMHLIFPELLLQIKLQVAVVLSIALLVRMEILRMAEQMFILLALHLTVTGRPIHAEPFIII